MADLTSINTLNMLFIWSRAGSFHGTHVKYKYSSRRTQCTYLLTVHMPTWMFVGGIRLVPRKKKTLSDEMVCHACKSITVSCRVYHQVMVRGLRQELRDNRKQSFHFTVQLLLHNISVAHERWCDILLRSSLVLIRTFIIHNYMESRTLCKWVLAYL